MSKRLRGVHPDKSAANICKLRQTRHAALCHSQVSVDSAICDHPSHKMWNFSEMNAAFQFALARSSAHSEVAITWVAVEIVVMGNWPCPNWVVPNRLWRFLISRHGPTWSIFLRPMFDIQVLQSSKLCQGHRTCKDWQIHDSIPRIASW